MMNVKTMVNAIAQGREEFNLTYEIYNSLDIEIQKELDRNYWRFPMFSKGYLFTKMSDKEKAHFENQEMVIHHSVWENC